MNINWFPGHMKKTKELVKKNLKLVDVVFELLDARIPLSSKNPDIDVLVGNKPRIVVLNKQDLSSDEANKQWIKYYEKKGIKAVLVDAAKGKGTEKIISITKDMIKNKMERLKEKGIKNKPIRAMIVGVPNVGKSTLINSLAGSKSAKTGNRPGVTKGKQWIKLRGNLELLDTPGILWPKFEDEKVGLNLAFTGAIKDEIIDVETLALRLVEKLQEIAPLPLKERYSVEVEDRKPIDVLDDIALKRGCIIKGGEIDYTRVARLILDEFRNGKIGSITLEYPDNI
ncbi:ribosome biogenesis GTPase YlqF [Caldisalinibacter kiritimatiensis]|uniref:Ribosome biogenesis GTPase A n=1 Tax=Caldisalinibacter kiritimatiensis TaxID=1304284 RepID=R1CF90_9FIRM|nr:ribosome biogenesis GTPase YlqF [Caldisalinibacter kiritimatiensis]EOD00955.1 50S ribosomal subunit maturation GTPase [Caldisalinibacter kiritimatiensis]